MTLTEGTASKTYDLRPLNNMLTYLGISTDSYASVFLLSMILTLDIIMNAFACLMFCEFV